MFDALEDLDGEWHEDAEPDQLEVIRNHREYAFYVFTSAQLAEEHTQRFGWCQFDQDDLFTYNEWLANGRPFAHNRGL